MEREPEKSLVEFAGHAIEFYDDLTEKQSVYLYWRLLGYTPGQSAKKSGYGQPAQAARANEDNPLIRQIVADRTAQNKVKYNMDVHDVVGGMLEALSVARERSDAKTMLESWKEISTQLGLAAPEKKVIEIQGEITHDHIASASDAELLRLLEKKRELPEIIDAEFEEVKDDSQTDAED